jgi:hypothetical protein
MSKKTEDKNKNNIRFDWAMKRLLREKANYVVLEGFFSVMLEDDITIESIVDDKKYPERFNRVDIRGKNRKGETVLIEMQNSNEKDFLHHLNGDSHLLIEKKYEKTKRVYSLYIINSERVAGEGYFFCDELQFRDMLNNTVLELSDKETESIERFIGPYPKTYFIKVNNFDDKIEIPMDEWVYYLKNNVILDNFKVKGIAEAREILKTGSLSE